MRNLLERSIASVDHRLVLLAPPGTIPTFFQNVEVDADLHERRCREMQALRGGVYFRDGAVERNDLTQDGLHRTPEDAKSWHVLMLDEDGALDSCIWYLEHDNSVTIDDLRASHCPANLRAESRDKFRRAVNAEIRTARKEGLRYAESGGWAVSEQSRCSSDGLVLALAAFSLGNISGGVRALSTATCRHGSSTILRRLGGSSLEIDGEEVLPYFDPKYKCEMELLRFDSRRPNPRYASLVAMLQERLADVVVISKTAVELGVPVHRFDQQRPAVVEPRVVAA